MTANVRLYGKDPILLVDFNGAFNLQTVQAMFQQCDTLVNDLTPPAAWRLVDLSQAATDFSDVMTIIKKTHPAIPGGFADPRIQTIFCPPHPMAKLMSEMCVKEQYGGVRMQIFPGLGEALLYVQDQIHSQFSTGV